MTTQYYKFLRLVDGKIKSHYGDHTWEVGTTYRIPDDQALRKCSVGFHASPTIAEALYHVQGEVLAVVESDDEPSINDSDKVVFRSMRLVRTAPWNTEDSVALAIYAAELVLPLFEAAFPNDGKSNPDAARDDAYAAVSAADAARAATKEQINSWILQRKFGDMGI